MATASIPSRDNMLIGELVMELGYCTRHQVDEGLGISSRNQLLGEILVKLGYLTYRQLEWVLVYQDTGREHTNTLDCVQFAKQQRRGLVQELRAVNRDIHTLTAKINNSKS